MRYDYHMGAPSSCCFQVIRDGRRRCPRSVAILGPRSRDGVRAVSPSCLRLDGWQACERHGQEDAVPARARAKDASGIVQTCGDSGGAPWVFSGPMPGIPGCPPSQAQSIAMRCCITDHHLKWHGFSEVLGKRSPPKD